MNEDIIARSTIFVISRPGWTPIPLRSAGSTRRLTIRGLGILPARGEGMKLGRLADG